MNSQHRVMMLIDADNVSADVMDQAVDKVVADHGAAHVRRAYCTPEAALANMKLFKARSIRPIVNLSTGKNSTDICLAVDAMDLVVTERPDVVVIVSSDSDFAPLVIRLREKGCRVEGIGQLGKTGEDSKGVYDAFADIEHRRSGAKPAASAPPARKRASPRSKLAPAVEVKPVPVAPVRKAPVPAPVSAPVKPLPEAVAEAPVAATKSRSRRGKAATASTGVPSPVAVSPVAPAPAPVPVPVPAPRPALPDDLRSILAVLPELARGQKLDLGLATERLRSEELLGPRAPCTRLFRKYPEWFALSPEKQPNKVEYLGPPKA